MIALLCLLPLAGAWTTPGLVWAETPVSVTWGGLPDGIDHAETVAALEAARAAWAEASCGGFDVTFVETDDPPVHEYEGVNAIVFGDPDHELDDYSLAVTFSLTSRETVEVAGEDYHAIDEADIVLSDLPFGTDAAIDAGCTDTWSFQALVTQHLGYLAGVGPSCGPYDEECAFSSWFQDATMYEFPGACHTGPSTLEDDDRLAIRWLYGHGFDATCAPDPADPMGAVCQVDYPAGGAATWDFGDGTTAEGAAFTHSYAEPGAYVVTACADVEGCDTPSCAHALVWAVGPGTVTGTDPDEDTGGDEAPGGCTTTSPIPALFPLALLAVRRRTRRR